MKFFFAFIFVVTSFFLFQNSAFAAEGSKKSSEASSSHGTDHPPHDHQKTDHMKYLRGHHPHRKRKAVSV
jgi:hypothetical protein